MCSNQTLNGCRLCAAYALTLKPLGNLTRAAVHRALPALLNFTAPILTLKDRRSAFDSLDALVRTDMLNDVKNTG